MLCRALLTAIAISYLICVLFLSGIQKDDLDVSMLMKLKKHNVNIDDMNNDKIRQHCLSESTTTKSTTKGVNVDGKRNKTNTELFMGTSTTERNSEEKDLVRTLKTNMDKVMKFISTQQQILEKNTKSIQENSKTIQPTQGHIQQVNQMYDGSVYIENIMTTTRPTTKHVNVKSEIEYDNGKPILESVIKFWQMYMKNNETKDDTRNSEAVTKIIEIPKTMTNKIIYQESTSSTIPQNIQNNANRRYRENEYRGNENTANNYNENKYTDRENNVNNYHPENMYKDPENNESKEIEHISRMLTNYLSRKRTKSTRAKPENEQNFQLSRVSQQLNTFLANNALLNNVKEDINVQDQEQINFKRRQSFPDNTDKLRIKQDEKLWPNKPYNEMEKTMQKPIDSGSHNQEFNNNKYYTTTQESSKYINDEQQTEVYIQGKPDKVYYDQYEKFTMEKDPIEQIAYNNDRNLQDQDHINNKRIKSFPDNTGKLRNEKLWPNKSYNEKEKTMLKPMNSVNGNREFNNNKYYTTTLEASKSINEQQKDVYIQAIPDKVYYDQYEKFTMEKDPVESKSYNNDRNERDQEHINFKRIKSFPDNSDELRNEKRWPNKSYNEKEKTMLKPMNSVNGNREYNNNKYYTSTLEASKSINEQQKDVYIQAKPDKVYNDQYEKFTIEKDPVESKSYNNERNVRDQEHMNFKRIKSFPDNTDKLRNEKLWPKKSYNEKEKTMLKPIDFVNDNREFNNNKYYTTSQESSKYINEQQKGVYIQAIPDKVFYDQYEKSTMEKDPIEPTTYNDQQKETYKQMKPDKVYYDRYEKAATKEAPVKHLAPEVLKKIADSVKEIVLKDLRRETTTTSATTSVTTTTKTILTTTTEQTPTTVIDIATTTAKKLDSSKVQKATQAIEKFIDLFEQFNYFREKTDVTPEAKYKTTERVEEIKGYTVPIEMMYEAPPKIQYATRISAIQRPPMMFNPYVYKSNGHTHKQNIINIIKPLHHTPVVNINQMRAAPIMIQTDPNEIPPLLIPLSQSMLINNNIIVTTEFPFEINKADRPRWQYMSQYGRNPDTKEDIQNRKETLSAYSNIDFKKRIREFGKPKKREGMGGKFENWEEKLHSRNRNDSAKMKYREKPTHKGDNERNHHNVHNVPYHLEHNRAQQRDHSIRGFHERLENLDDWPEHNKDSKVVSRQQMPLNDMKIVSNYDDSHFRNFLKTQQKVNDMLESILGTQARHDGPRSVESI